MLVLQGANSGEQQLFDLLQLINDPQTFEKRLRELVTAKNEAYQAFVDAQEKEKSVASWHEALKVKEAAIQEADAQLVHKTKAVDKLTAVMKTKKDELLALKTQVDAIKSANAATSSHLAEWEEKLQRKSQELEARETGVMERESAVEAREAKLREAAEAIKV
jgi:chromosome segregation ATPase